MKNYFRNKINHIDLFDLELNLSEISNSLKKLKELSENEFIQLYDSPKVEEPYWMKYKLELGLFEKSESIYLNQTHYSQVLIEEEIDRHINPVGYAQQLKRKRRVLIEVGIKLKKGKEKLLRIRKGILTSTYNYNIAHDFRQNLRRVLRKNMPLSIDEEEGNSSIIFSKTFNLLNAKLELLNNKYKPTSKWILVKYYII